jgi:hypothetical protein
MAGPDLFALHAEGRAAQRPRAADARTSNSKAFSVGSQLIASARGSHTPP